MADNPILRRIREQAVVGAQAGAAGGSIGALGGAVGGASTVVAEPVVNKLRQMLEGGRKKLERLPVRDFAEDVRRAREEQRAELEADIDDLERELADWFMGRNDEDPEAILDQLEDKQKTLDRFERKRLPVPGDIIGPAG